MGVIYDLTAGRAVFVVGDTRSLTRNLPDHSVDLILTSPPFLALRSYLPEGHPDKDKEIGQEGTPGQFLDVLLDLTEEWRRILAPHGSIVVELGDSQSGSGGAGGDYNKGGSREGQEAFAGTARRAKDGWPAKKSACMIPELYRVALVYGINPLTGRTTPQWRVRNTVRWVRPNPPVGKLYDNFRRATSDLVVACGTDEAGRTRWFDLDAVRTPHKSDPTKYTGNGYTKGNPKGTGFQVMEGNPNGAPPLDWWEVSTASYKGSHYATWPKRLLEIPVKSMCPTRVCTVCGEPSRRLVDKDTQRTVGWSNCGHKAWRPGVVFDPFAGSGTTLEVAAANNRVGVGFDLDVRNVALARKRMGDKVTILRGTDQ